MNQPLLFALTTALAVLTFFIGIWRLLPRRSEVDSRLQHYAEPEWVTAAAAQPRARRQWTLIGRLVTGFGLAPALAKGLAQADLPLTVAEFAAMVLAAGGVGLFLGWLRDNLIIGLLAALVFGAIPFLYLKITQLRRQRAFANQLPDVLTLLVGALRAGYGLNQAIAVLVEQLPAPSSTEFDRIQRAVNLGVPLLRALGNRAKLLENDDLDLVITAINVQYEVGGNLAQVLDTIAETIRERIRILREVRVLTAQQRLTGYILTAVPLGLAVALSILKPGFFDPFFEPGLAQYLPYIAIFLLSIGFLLIRRIVDIKV
ncbi:MAG: type II secretion system F family protein [Caldilineaceae bacterium]